MALHVMHMGQNPNITYCSFCLGLFECGSVTAALGKWIFPSLPVPQTLNPVRATFQTDTLPKTMGKEDEEQPAPALTPFQRQHHENGKHSKSHSLSDKGNNPVFRYVLPLLSWTCDTGFHKSEVFGSSGRISELFSPPAGCRSPLSPPALAAGWKWRWREGRGGSGAEGALEGMGLTRADCNPPRAPKGTVPAPN